MAGGVGTFDSHKFIGENERMKKIGKNAFMLEIESNVQDKISKKYETLVNAVEQVDEKENIIAKSFRESIE